MPVRVSAQPLPASLLDAWREELRGAHSQEARAHWWTESHWVPAEALGPSTLLGATVAHLCAHLVPELASDLSGVEFWIQRRKPSAGLQAHWDCDEDQGRVNGQLLCPIASTVLYLSGVGGPTLILGSRPGPPPMHTEREDSVAAWFVWPRSGQAVAFRGDMLHAVVGLATPPPEAPGTACEPSQPALRETIVFNFWLARPAGLDDIPAVLLPPACPARCASAQLQPNDTPFASSCVDAAVRPSGREGCAGEEEGCAPPLADCVKRTLLLGMFDRTCLLTCQTPAVEGGEQTRTAHNVSAVQTWATSVAISPHTSV